MKHYRLKTSDNRLLVHIDAYRLDSSAEMKTLGFDTLIADPENLIVIEWPERIADILPADCIRISLEHLEENKRALVF